MPSYFFDSSALVKRYHREPGTDWVKAVCDARERPKVYISQIARVEGVAALRRLGRVNAYHPSFVDAMTRMFERDFTLSAASRQKPVYIVVPLSPAILEYAATLCGTYWQAQPHPLRSLDAVQLACGVAMAVAAADELRFVTSDTRLGAIALYEGLPVLNPMYSAMP
jgi:predicted nucleic acid-binding protein